ncbi:MAG: hypothetical protein ACOYVK_01570 [Bacillota bacterium]
MLVAQRKYYDYTYEKNTAEQNQEKIKTKEKKRKVSVFQKLQVFFSVSILGALCIGVLLGYVQVTETKYRLHNMENEMKQLENQIENLKVKVEMVKRSDLVEEKAKNLLGMQYPTKEQMIFLTIPNVETEGISDKELELAEVAKGKTGFFANIKVAMQKLYSLID